MALPPPRNDRAGIITGASSGIGVEFAQILSRRGYQVVMVARSADRLQELAGRLAVVVTKSAYLTLALSR
jgi:uncharacterized protein